MYAAHNRVLSFGLLHRRLDEPKMVSEISKRAVRHTRNSILARLAAEVLKNPMTVSAVGSVKFLLTSPIWLLRKSLMFVYDE